LFGEGWKRDFNPPGEVARAVLRLADLFDSCAITTNFDRVLEKAYEKCGKAFVEKTTGRGPAESATPSTALFQRAIATCSRSTDTSRTQPSAC
jgi:hypothetical protein